MKQTTCDIFSGEVRLSRVTVVNGFDLVHPTVR